MLLPSTSEKLAEVPNDGRAISVVTMLRSRLANLKQMVSRSINEMSFDGAQLLCPTKIMQFVLSLMNGVVSRRTFFRWSMVILYSVIFGTIYVILVVILKVIITKLGLTEVFFLVAFGNSVDLTGIKKLI